MPMVLEGGGIILQTLFFGVGGKFLKTTLSTKPPAPL